MTEKIIEEVLEWFTDNCYENPPVELEVDIAKCISLALQKERANNLRIITQWFYDRDMKIPDALYKSLKGEK